MELIQWVEDSGLGIYVREDLWGFAIMLSLHAVGMAMSLGVVLIVNLRVLGLVPAIPIQSYSGLFGTAWFGFAINLLSGFALYSSHAVEYSTQLVFMLKLLLLTIGGILMKVLMNNVRAGAPDSKLKMISALCIASWVGAIITGRLMAYF